MKHLFLFLALVLAALNAQGAAERDISTGIITAKEQASAPSSPSSGRSKLYYRDGKWRSKNSAGTETTVGTGSGGSNNILVNGDFEDGTGSWTLTAGTGSSESTVVLAPGLKSYKVTLSAQTLNLCQSVTTGASQFNGTVQGMAEGWGNTTISGIYACSVNNGTTDYRNCSAITASAGWVRARMPFMLTGTSNGICFVSGTLSSGLVTPGPVTGDFYADASSVGIAADFDTVPVETNWTSYTPTFTGFGTVSGVDCRHAQRGPNRLIDCKFTIGTSTATEARVSLPGTDVSTTNFSTIKIAGSAGVNASTTTTVPLIEPGVSYITFGQQVATGSGAFTKVNGSTIGASGSQVSFLATVPVVGLSATVNTFIDQCTSDYQCAPSFSFKVSPTAVVSDQSAGLTWVTGCSVASTSNFTCNFNTTALGLTAAPVCHVNYYGAGSTAANRSAPIKATTTSALTYLTEASGALSPSDVHVTCFKTGADLKISRQIIGSFKEIPKAPGRSSPKEYQATITCSSSSSVSQDGSWVSSIGNIDGNGTCLVSLVANTLASGYKCFDSVTSINVATSGMGNIFLHSKSTSQFEVRCQRLNAGSVVACTSFTMDITCSGASP